MKTYHTETEEDYNSLMVELEKQGYKWLSGKKPTEEFIYKVYKSETTITTFTNVISYSCVKDNMENYPDEPIIEYKAKKKVETNDFIKELTVKIYYNEITKKHYNSYEEAIADCKKEMEHNMIKIEGGSTAGKIFWENFKDFQSYHDLFNTDIAKIIYERTEYGHYRKSASGISSNISQLVREKNNPNNNIANAILHVMSYVEKREITYSDVYTKNFFR